MGFLRRQFLPAVEPVLQFFRDPFAGFVFGLETGNLLEAAVGKFRVHHPGATVFVAYLKDGGRHATTSRLKRTSRGSMPQCTRFWTGLFLSPSCECRSPS